MSRRVGLVVAACFLALALAEWAARAIYFVDDPFFNRPIDRRSRLPAYRGASYDVGQLYRELAGASRIAYEPYTIWRRRPYRGALVTVEPAGERTTRHNSSRPEAAQIWMFGGSTMWGTGVPDDETIPSRLSALVNGSGLDARVRNLGEKGYVSTQELVRLMRELQRGGRPDVVIFYDGWNDVLCGLAWPEEPGAHFGLDRVRDRLDGQSGLGPWLRSTGLYRLTAWGWWQARDPVDRPTAAELAARANRIAETWIANYDLVDALAARYRFMPVFCWQPARFDDARVLGPFDGRLVTGQMMRNADAVVRVRLAEASRAAGRRLYDLGSVFDQVAQPVFIDPVHTTGTGNELIAREMYRVLAPDLQGWYDALQRPQGAK